MTSISFTQLTLGSLGNHNAGDTIGNTTELKTHDDRAYISGQSYRQAIRHAFRQISDRGVDCTQKYACGRIGECKICDVFGYMNTDLSDDDLPKANRTSPLKVTPLFSQYRSPITSDRIAGFDTEEDDHDIAHRQITETVYQGAVLIEANRIGKRVLETIDSDKEWHEKYNREVVEKADSEEVTQRVEDLLTAIERASHFAGQSRHMADMMPDLLVGAVQEQHNHRIADVLEVNPDEHTLNTDVFESKVRDIVNRGGEVFIAGTYSEDVITNWDEVFETAESLDGVHVADSITDCFDQVREEYVSE